MDIKELYKLFLQHPIVTTDSRDCPDGSIFFALKGESFNGNAYAAQALDKGCAYAVIDDPQYMVPGDTRFILTHDVLRTLQLLAREHRRALGTTIIGITGTNGKTTTKELIATVLSEKYNTLYTQGNFNNHIGVPKTLLQLRREHQMAVVEMGANHPGEIKTLVEIVEPDYGLITNVGKAHLLGFGSFEGVIRTKGELYDFLRGRDSAKVFIHHDNPHLQGIAQHLQKIEYGATNPSLFVNGEVLCCDPFMRMRWRSLDGPWHQVDSHLIGSYNVHNMLAAACVGMTFDVSPDAITHALASYQPKNNRSQLTHTGSNHLIVDTYNANPTSMGAALDNFKAMAVAPKMVILGEMGELGESSQAEHQAIIDRLPSVGCEKVWLVGSEFEKIPSPYMKFPNVEAVKKALAAQKPQGYYILIKGSNYNRLFELPEQL